MFFVLDFQLFVGELLKKFPYIPSKFFIAKPIKIGFVIGDI